MLIKLSKIKDFDELFKNILNSLFIIYNYGYDRTIHNLK